MTPARQPHPQEYIITMGRIIKARNMLMVDGYHNADVLDRMVNLLRARPHTSPPAPAHRTWESCHKHFACPDGEECWYWSADYYWDCGKGSARLIEGRIEAAKAACEQVLDDIASVIDPTMSYVSRFELEQKIQSLRAQQAGRK
jgi:hypothetical protein